MLGDLIFSINIALPIFLVMFVGHLLKRKKVVDENFIKMANQLVFNVALPVKLFTDVYHTSLNEALDVKFIIYIVAGIILSVAISWLLGLFLIKDQFQLGAFIQGSFRGNFVYVGLSLMENIIGSPGLKAPIAVAFAIPLYNILAVIVLTYTNRKNNSKISPKNILKDIIRNPLIIAVVLGVIATQVNFKIPTLFLKTMNYFEVIATPLALITIGATFNIKRLTKNLRVSLLASSLKLIIIPFIAVVLALMLGFAHEDVLLIYVLFGVPTATTSYIMTAVMNGDEVLSSDIIMITTLLSNITITLFTFAFRRLGMI